MATSGKRPTRNSVVCPEWRKKSNVFDDPCSVNVREHQSIETSQYPTSNFFRRCGEPVMTDCTLNQTFTFPKTHGISQCNIGNDSQLRYAPLTDLKNIHQLHTRPYVGTGYRGAGANSLKHKDIESALIHGNSATNYKSCEDTSGVYIDRWDYLPEHGAPNVYNTIFGSKPNSNFIPHRNGVSTRNLVRKIAREDLCHGMTRG